MKSLQKVSILILATSLVFGACKKKDPEPVNEQEVITKVTLRFTNTANTSEVVNMVWEDSDGIGGNAPTITSGTLKRNTTYNIDIDIKGEGNEDITQEILDEADEHQVYFGFSTTTLFSNFEYLDQDSNNKPLGLKTRATTINNSGGGNLQVILVHEGNKTQNVPATPWVYTPNVGGEQDFNIIFNAVVE
ncbi:MAG: hypothetical protein OHK0045_11370 [Raineya sp.]